MPRKKRNRRGRRSAIAKLTVAELMQEMERRRGMLGSLHDRRVTIEHELEVLGSEISQLENIGGANGQQGRRGPGRPKGSTNARKSRVGKGRGRGNEQSLGARLHQLLRNRTMSVAEMAEAVKKAGHKSKSKNFGTIVGLALMNKKLFKRVSRGQYTAR